LKIVAVNGSLVRDGNVKALLDHALAEYDGKPQFEVKLFEISRMTIGPCRHCNWCFKKQTQDKYCAQDDDMAEVYPELMESVALIVASPVHFGRLSGATADFIDRFRVFVHGNVTRGAMRNKVGGALAVAWFRNAGLEQTLITINTAFQALGMVVASPDLGVHGAAAFSSVHGTGETRQGERLLVKSDDFGMASARSVAYRVGELATLIQAGRQD
jgi:multimeric flavodoxin WrbA